MALHEMESDTLRTDYHGPNCAYLCWLPIVMGFLSLSVGICCLFFMCPLGVILCILNCVLGLIFAYFTYSTHAHPKRYKAIVAIIGNLMHIGLLVFTLVHGSRLLVLNVRAEAKNNAADVSPAFNMMLDFYFAHAGFESSPSPPRLEGAKEPPSIPSSPSDTRLPDSQPIAENQTNVPSDPGISEPEKAASSLLPVLSPDTLETGEQSEHSQHDVLLTTQASRFDSIVSSLHVSAKDVSWTHHKTDDASAESGGKKKKRRGLQKKKGKTPYLISQQSSNSSEEDREENLCVSCQFSTDDMACILKAVSSSTFADSVLRRFRSLLYWGLFCGYVERGLILVTKRNIRCSDECFFDQFHFSRHRQNEARTRTQAAQLMKNIKGMTRRQARICAANAAVASCRVQETFMHHGVAAALCAALPLSFVLVMFCCSCVVACWKIAQRCRKKVQST